MFDPSVLISLGLVIAILLGLQGGWGFRPPGWSIFALYFVLLTLVNAWRRKVRSGNGGTEADSIAPGAEWPTSGPIGRWGQRGLIMAFSVTGLLALLNPLQLLQIVRQGLGNAAIRFRLAGAAKRHTPPGGDAIEYSLPFHGEWLVYNGGIDEVHSHSWRLLTQRYAYDFVLADADHKRHSGRGTTPEEYLCWDREILAPADGTVVTVCDGIRTAPFLGYGVVDFLARSFIGNHVVLEHGPSEFSLSAHLIRGTIPVREGQRVSRGEVIGRCGHSGHSSEPHLHFHLQDRKGFFAAAGMPITFKDISIAGEGGVERHIRVGDRVATTAPNPLL